MTCPQLPKAYTWRGFSCSLPILHLCHILHRPQISIHCYCHLHRFVMRLVLVFGSRHRSRYKMKALSRRPRSFLCKQKPHLRTAPFLTPQQPSSRTIQKRLHLPLGKHAALFLTTFPQRSQTGFYLLRKYAAPFLTTQQPSSRRSHKRLHLSGSPQHPDHSPPTSTKTKIPSEHTSHHLHSDNCSTIQHLGNRRNVSTGE